MSNELFSLNGKIALVTGASSGLGYHFSKVLADAGAQIVVAARRKNKLEQLVKDIQKAGGSALAIQMDVTDKDSVDDAFDEIEKELGVVDVLINNAGVAKTQFFTAVEEADWDYTMDTNLKGAWRVGSVCSKRLIAAGKPGSIINLSSILSVGTQTMQSVYAISKAGVSHMTHCMAAELMRYKIRVNAIAPGYFLSEMNEDFFNSEKGQAYIKILPARRLGENEELTGAVLLLASEAGSFITGVVLPVDGGHLVGGR
jgi:NAD(P)-dependent dehydrogenase (short-subunit alcohol dehydrogenase family)